MILIIDLISFKLQHENKLHIKRKFLFSTKYQDGRTPFENEFYTRKGPQSWDFFVGRYQWQTEKSANISLKVHRNQSFLLWRNEIVPMNLVLWSVSFMSLLQSTFCLNATLSVHSIHSISNSFIWIYLFICISHPNGYDSMQNNSSNIVS